MGGSESKSTAAVVVAEKTIVAKTGETQVALENSANLAVEFENALTEVSKNIYKTTNGNVLMEMTKHLYEKYESDDLRTDEDKEKIESAYGLLKRRFVDTHQGYDLALDLCDSRCGIGLVTFVCAAAFLQQKKKSSKVLTIVLPENRSDIDRFKKIFEPLLVELSLYTCNVKLIFRDGLSPNGYMALRTLTKTEIYEKIRKGDNVLEYKFVNVLRYFTGFSIDIKMQELQFSDRFTGENEDNVLSVTFMSNVTLVEHKINGEELKGVITKLTNMDFGGSAALTNEKPANVNSDALSLNVCVIAETNGDTTMRMMAVLCTGKEYDDLVSNFDMSNGKMKKGSLVAIDRDKSADSSSVFWLLDLKGTKRSGTETPTGKIKSSFVSSIDELVEKTKGKTRDDYLGAQKIFVRVLSKKYHNSLVKTVQIEAPFIVMDSKIHIKLDKPIIFTGSDDDETLGDFAESTPETAPKKHWYGLPVMYWDTEGGLGKRKATYSRPKSDPQLEKIVKKRHDAIIQDVMDQPELDIEEVADEEDIIDALFGGEEDEGEPSNKPPAKPRQRKKKDAVEVVGDWAGKYGQVADKKRKEILDKLKDIKPMEANEMPQQDISTEEGKKLAEEKKKQFANRNSSITRYKTNVTTMVANVGPLVDGEIRKVYGEKLVSAESEEVISKYIEDVILLRLSKVAINIEEAVKLVKGWHEKPQAPKDDILSVTSFSKTVTSTNVMDSKLNAKLTRIITQKQSKLTEFVKPDAAESLLWDGYTRIEPNDDDAGTPVQKKINFDGEAALIKRVNDVQEDLIKLLNGYNYENLPDEKRRVFTAQKAYIRDLIRDTPRECEKAFYATFVADYPISVAMTDRSFGVLYEVVLNQLNFLKNQVTALVGNPVTAETVFIRSGFVQNNNAFKNFLRTKLKEHPLVFPETMDAETKKKEETKAKLSKTNMEIFRMYDGVFTKLDKCSFGVLRAERYEYENGVEIVCIDGMLPVQKRSVKQTMLPFNGNAAIEVPFFRLLKENTPLTDNEKAGGAPTVFGNQLGCAETLHSKQIPVWWLYENRTTDSLRIDLVSAEKSKDEKSKDGFVQIGQQKEFHKVSVGGSSGSVIVVIESISSKTFKQDGWHERVTVAFNVLSDDARAQVMEEEEAAKKPVKEKEAESSTSSKKRGTSRQSGDTSASELKAIELDVELENLPRHVSPEHLLQDEKEDEEIISQRKESAKFDEAVDNVVGDLSLVRNSVLAFLAEMPAGKINELYESLGGEDKTAAWLEDEIVKCVSMTLDELDDEYGGGRNFDNSDTSIKYIVEYNVKRIVFEHRKAEEQALIDKLVKEVMEMVNAYDPIDKQTLMDDIVEEYGEDYIDEDEPKSEDEVFELKTTDLVTDALDKTTAELGKSITELVLKKWIDKLWLMVQNVVLSARQNQPNAGGGGVMDVEFSGAKIVTDKDYTHFYVISKDGQLKRFFVDVNDQHKDKLEKLKMGQVNGPFSLPDAKSFTYPEIYVVVKVAGKRNVADSYKLEFIENTEKKMFYSGMKLKARAEAREKSMSYGNEKNSGASFSALKVEAV